MPESADRESLKRQERLMKLLQAGNSGGYERVAKRLWEARELFHEEIAHQMQDPMNRQLAQMPQATPEEKKSMGRWLNAELRALSLAIRCPKTGEPAIVHVDPWYESKGRFQIELIEKQGGRRVRTVSSVSLPSLEYCPHPVRREPFAEHWGRVASRRNETSRER